jgi:hypothetical protein
MGRVRKYKKIKACDPNSKQNNGRRAAAADMRHDDPPEEHDARAKRKAKALERPFDDLDHAERMLQREAMRALRNAQTADATGTSNNNKNNTTTSAGKRADETMRDFQKRIRNETKVALRDELQKMTKTAQKKKEHMRAKKLAKKQQRQEKAAAASGGTQQEQQRRAKAAEEREYFDSDFNQRADGLLRPSDLGAPASFPGRGSDVVLFGERVVAPPDLKALGQMLDKKKRARMAAATAMPLPPADDHSDDDHSDDHSEANIQPKKKRRQRLDLDALEGDHGGLVGGSRKALSSGILHSGGGAGRAATSSVAEMEALRTRVQAAYKTLRDKRRDEALLSHARKPGNGGAGRGFVMMSDLY